MIKITTRLKLVLSMIKFNKQNSLKGIIYSEHAMLIEIAYIVIVLIKHVYEILVG